MISKVRSSDGDGMTDDEIGRVSMISKADVAFGRLNLGIEALFALGHSSSEGSYFVKAVSILNITALGGD